MCGFLHLLRSNQIQSRYIKQTQIWKSLKCGYDKIVWTSDCITIDVWGLSVLLSLSEAWLYCYQCLRLDCITIDVWGLIVLLSMSEVECTTIVVWGFIVLLSMSEAWLYYYQRSESYYLRRCSTPTSSASSAPISLGTWSNVLDVGVPSWTKETHIYIYFVLYLFYYTFDKHNHLQVLASQ